MSTDVERARKMLLDDPSLGVVAYRGGGCGGGCGGGRGDRHGRNGESDEILTGFGRGVRPLLQWLADGRSLLGYSAADRVVGKGAALLYARLGVVAVYGETMSEAGLATLQAQGIAASYGTLVPVILNRAHTGVCPIERSVAAIDDPLAAESAIRTAVAELMAAR
ncbi:hypothetical protein BW13_08765 [Bifidobacterium sp. UTCIF-37]|uniref:DUF1893 domain-containing protein n=1 Tax=unclassified Bifidobacterium TaxID=2608897 RepID=UPI0015E2898C|nr:MULTISPECIES: DUF1893 domain-containing protein [unclassified Bifidobacterium]TPF85804.1 hypothetical protein BW13_08765 [Bifidobacterium sp. UTCIF-37]TPF87873.1 hypothetical protein BW11_09555 [Bifidobacterium sp. UTCIF-38]